MSSVESALKSAHSVLSSSASVTVSSPVLLQILSHVLRALQAMHQEHVQLQSRVTDLTLSVEAMQRHAAQRSEVESLAQSLHDLADVVRTSAPPPLEVPPMYFDTNRPTEVAVEGPVQHHSSSHGKPVSPLRPLLTSPPVPPLPTVLWPKTGIYTFPRDSPRRDPLSLSSLPAEPVSQPQQDNRPLTPPKPQPQPSRPPPRLGMEIAEAPSGAGPGVVVCDLLSRSPGIAAGVRAGDIITELNGMPIRNRRDLHEALRMMKDDKALVLLSRRGESAPIRCTIVF